MKKPSLLGLLKLVVFLAVVAHALVFLTGCRSVRDRQVVEKSTVFGFQAKSPGPEGTQITIQFGLVRNFYLSNPTSTNAVHVAQFSTHVDADMTALHQNGKESMSTLPQAVSSSVSGSNSVSNVTTTK
jgi:hypothetical protein